MAREDLRERETTPLVQQMQQLANESIQSVLNAQGDNWREKLGAIDAVKRVQQMEQLFEGTVEFANKTLANAVSEIFVSATETVDASPEPLEPTAAEEQKPPPDDANPEQSAPVSQGSTGEDMNVEIGDNVSKAPEEPLQPIPTGSLDEPKDDDDVGNDATPTEPPDRNFRPWDPNNLTKTQKDWLSRRDALLKGRKQQGQQKPGDPRPPVQPKPRQDDDPADVARRTRDDFIRNGGQGFVPPFAASGFQVGGDKAMPIPTVSNSESEIEGTAAFMAGEAEVTARALIDHLARVTAALVYMQTELNELNEVLDRSFGG